MLKNNSRQARQDSGFVEVYFMILSELIFYDQPFSEMAGLIKPSKQSDNHEEPSQELAYMSFTSCKNAAFDLGKN